MDRLKDCIKKGPRVDSVVELPNHVDAAALWRSAYHESEKNQTALHARVAELERLQGHKETDEVATTLVSQNLRKRKPLRTNTLEDPHISPLKRAKTSTAAKKQGGIFLERATQNGDHYTLNDLGMTSPLVASTALRVNLGEDFLHQLYLLQQESSLVSPNPKNLALLLCRISECIWQLITESEQADNFRKAGDKIKYSAAMTENLAIPQSRTTFWDLYIARSSAIERVLPTLATTLRRLGHLPHSKSVESPVIHAFVKVFRGLLEMVCRLSTASYWFQNAAISGERKYTHSGRSEVTQSTKVVKPQYRTPCFRCKRRALTCDYASPTCTNCVKSREKCSLRRSKPTSAAIVPSIQKDVVQGLCKLAVTFFACLYEPVSIFPPIQDGCLFLLYEKVGQGLRAFTKDSEYDKVPQPDNGQTLIHHGPAVSNGDNREDEKVLEARAPHLIWILDRVQALVAKQYNMPNMETQVSHKAARTITIDTFRSSNEKLTVEARKKLQNTLVDVVFGSEADSPYKPALDRSHSPTDDDVSTSDLPDVEIQDWFKHEVWRIVGWDVLIEHIQWGED